MMKPRPSAPGTATQPRFGFTLVELLTVIAIIGILSSLLFVTFGGVTAGAKRAKTRVQFTQWASAMEAFRQEYGFYPDLRDPPNPTAPSWYFVDGVIDSIPESQRFVEALSGRKLDGNPLTSTSPGYEAGNTKNIRFCSFGQDDLNATNRLTDAFENAEIAVLVDPNFDGVITLGSGKEYSDFPEVNGKNPDIPASGGVRAGVIFYSPGAGKATEDIVKSW